MLLATLLVAFGVPGEVQKDNTQARIKAIYLYNIATLVDWPDKYKKGSFVIGVYGEDKLYEELVANHSTKTVGSQPIKVRKFRTEAEVERCHILFIGYNKNSSSANLVSKFKKTSTLIVTESPGMLGNGAVVNFIVQNNRQVYELSKKNASKYDLVVNSTLENYAARVE